MRLFLTESKSNIRTGAGETRQRRHYGILQLFLRIKEASTWSDQYLVNDYDCLEIFSQRVNSFMGSSILCWWNPVLGTCSHLEYEP